MEPAPKLTYMQLTQLLTVICVFRKILKNISCVYAFTSAHKIIIGMSHRVSPLISANKETAQILYSASNIRLLSNDFKLCEGNGIRGCSERAEVTVSSDK